jgi:hypothetical protein
MGHHRGQDARAAMFARRRVIEEVRARLDAVTSSLSASRIDVGELREDANELSARTHLSLGRGFRFFSNTVRR